jgi:Lar family restriction alleviation protein
MTDKLREALLPCPFCGGQAEFERTGTSGHSCIVSCGNCGARHESGDEYENSGSSWNSRAALAAPSVEPVAPDRRVFAIVFDDSAVPHEIVQGEAAARERFKHVSDNWHAHLFVKIASNTRDCAYPDAVLATPGELQWRCPKCRIAQSQAAAGEMTAADLRRMLRSLKHEDYPGDLWEITTVREKSLMLKVLRAYANSCMAAAPNGMTAPTWVGMDPGKAMHQHMLRWFDAFTKDRCDCVFETPLVEQWIGQLLGSQPYTPGPGAEQSALAEMEARKDAAYLERNQVVAALAKCFPSGVARTAIEGWSEDWHGCVYIDLPTGQASWHHHDSQAYLFEGLPPYTKPWDGHTTEEKYRRLAALVPNEEQRQRAALKAEVTRLRELLEAAVDDGLAAAHAPVEQPSVQSEPVDEMAETARFEAWWPTVYGVVTTHQKACMLNAWLARARGVCWGPR